MLGGDVRRKPDEPVAARRQAHDGHLFAHPENAPCPRGLEFLRVTRLARFHGFARAAVHFRPHADGKFVPQARARRRHVFPEQPPAQRRGIDAHVPGPAAVLQLHLRLPEKVVRIPHDGGHLPDPLRGRELGLAPGANLHEQGGDRHQQAQSEHDRAQRRTIGHDGDDDLPSGIREGNIHGVRSLGGPAPSTWVRVPNRRNEADL